MEVGMHFIMNNNELKGESKKVDFIAKKTISSEYSYLINSVNLDGPAQLKRTH